MNLVVIGAGLSGLVAAWEISKDEDIHVWVLSTGTGASPYVHGLNIVLRQEDSIECFKTDTLTSGYYLNDPVLVDILCKESTNVYSLLTELGIELDKKDGEYDLLRPLGSTHPRVASSGNHTGVKVMKSLKEELLKRPNVTFLDHTRALEIVMDNHAPKGLVICDEKQYDFYFLEASCIVLTGGGFCGIYPFSTNTKDIGGDIIAMAYNAGASLIDLEFIQFEPTVVLYPERVARKGIITTMFYDGACLRNKKLERFMLDISKEGEKVNKDVLAKAIYEEIKKGNGTEHGGVYFDATGVDRDILMERYLSYVKRYESVGIDISEEMIEVAPAPHTSLGGVLIDGNCATSVKGIYAAGEAAGGIHGANRIGGNAGLETLVFGRIAGLTAKQYIKELPVPVKDEKAPYPYKVNTKSGAKTSSTHPAMLRNQMEQLLADSFYVVRNQGDMADAKEKLEGLLSETEKICSPDNKTYYELLRLKNDLTCAYLLAVSAANRTESIGCHICEDAESDNYKYNTVVCRKQSKPYVYRKYQKGESGFEKNKNIKE